MKKVLLSVLLGTALLSGCCTVEKQSIREIEKTHDLILPKYVKYVEADVVLNDASKDDQKKLVESLKALVSALKKAVE